MSAQYLLPGGPVLTEATSGEYVVPGGPVVNENAAGGSATGTIGMTLPALSMAATGTAARGGGGSTVLLTFGF